MILVTALSALAGLLALSLVVSLERGRRLRTRMGVAERETQAVERELAALGRREAAFKLELEFLGRFVREFPHLTRDLHAPARQREIPGLVLKVAVRTLEPKWAVVLLRRHPMSGEAPIAKRLVVAAATPGAPIALGADLGDQLAIALEPSGGRLDVEQGSGVARLPARPAGFDLVAPIISGEDTLGAIALCQPVRASEEAKAALRLIAQAGAQALQSSAAFRQIENSANLDGLTGVFNKRHMTQALGDRILDAQRRTAALSVFLFDVDNFKHYNDTNGHVAGDQLLKALARLVRENVRQEDIFGRFGGEEFLLILPDTPLPAGLAVAYKLRRLIASHPFAFAERQPLGCLSVSGGVAEYPGDALDSANLLRGADEALYSAKRAGRNRVLPAERRFLGGAEPAYASEASQGAQDA